MKITAIVLLLLVCAACAQAQTVVLNYNTALTPDQQGFTLGGTCSNMWSVANGILQFRDCTGSAPVGYAVYNNLLAGATTVQVDVRMRIVDSLPTTYAFEFYLGRNNDGASFYLNKSDFGDVQWHDLTLFYNYSTYAFSSYLDGNPVNITHNYAYLSAFGMGDGNGGAMTWGNVDISSLKVTVGYEQAVDSRPVAWGAIKSLYR